MELVAVREIAERKDIPVTAGIGRSKEEIVVLWLVIYERIAIELVALQIASGEHRPVRDIVLNQHIGCCPAEDVIHPAAFTRQLYPSLAAYNLDILVVTSSDIVHRIILVSKELPVEVHLRHAYAVAQRLESGLYPRLVGSAVKLGKSLGEVQKSVRIPELYGRSLALVLAFDSGKIRRVDLDVPGCRPSVKDAGRGQ